MDGVLGTRTRGGRMVGADESTELLRHPNFLIVRVHLGTTTNGRYRKVAKEILRRMTE